MGNKGSFREMLTGGHPNSLGRTVEVVDLVLADRSLLKELIDCYSSKDELVRLRTSNALKRICREQPEWLLPYIDHLLNDVSKINQASTQWTLAQLLLELDRWLSVDQKKQAVAILQHNLANQKDWIVLNMSMKTLGAWAREDGRLTMWLIPHLKRLKNDSRKSVSKAASEVLQSLETV